MPPVKAASLERTLEDSRKGVPPSSAARVRVSKYANWKKSLAVCFGGGLLILVVVVLMTYLAPPGVDPSHDQPTVDVARFSLTVRGLTEETLRADTNKQLILTGAMAKLLEVPASAVRIYQVGGTTLSRRLQTLPLAVSFEVTLSNPAHRIAVATKLPALTAAEAAQAILAEAAIAGESGMDAIVVMSITVTQIAGLDTCQTTSSVDSNCEDPSCGWSEGAALATFTANLGAACVFPFTYRGVEYHACTNIDHYRPWCATSGGFMAGSGLWGNCDDQCLGGDNHIEFPCSSVNLCCGPDPKANGTFSPPVHTQMTFMISAENRNALTSRLPDAENTLRKNTLPGGLVMAELTPKELGFVLNDSSVAFVECASVIARPTKSTSTEEAVFGSSSAASNEVGGSVCKTTAYGDADCGTDPSCGWASGQALENFKANLGAPCVFPFVYKGVSYHHCTSEDHYRPWCATSSGFAQGAGLWGNCEEQSCSNRHLEFDCLKLPSCCAHDLTTTYAPPVDYQATFTVLLSDAEKRDDLLSALPDAQNDVRSGSLLPNSIFMAQLSPTEVGWLLNKTAVSDVQCPAVTTWGMGEVAPFDCSASGTWPIQVWSKKSTGPYQVDILNATGGEYQQLWTVPLDQTVANVSKLNAVSINPLDVSGIFLLPVYSVSCIQGKVYGRLEYNDGQTNTNYLVRFDNSRFEFLEQMLSGHFAGAFTPSGSFIVRQSKKLIKYNGNNLINREGFHDPRDVGSDKSYETIELKFAGAGVDNFNGADLVVFTAMIESNEPTEYIIEMRKKSYNATLANVATGAAWLLTPSNMEELLAANPKLSSWGSGWLYENTIYFSRNDAGGVYRLDKENIDINKGTMTLSRVGSSGSHKTSNNDGMNCPHAADPWLPEANCDICNFPDCYQPHNDTFFPQLDLDENRCVDGESILECSARCASEGENCKGIAFVNASKKFYIASRQAHEDHKCPFEDPHRIFRTCGDSLSCLNTTNTENHTVQSCFELCLSFPGCTTFSVDTVPGSRFFGICQGCDVRSTLQRHETFEAYDVVRDGACCTQGPGSGNLETAEYWPGGKTWTKINETCQAPPTSAPTPVPTVAHPCDTGDNICDKDHGKCTPRVKDEIDFVDGPNVDNMLCRDSEWYGTLENAQQKCRDDPSCGWLHDFACDNKNWRVCGTVGNDNSELIPGDEKACTKTRKTIYHHASKTPTFNVRRLQDTATTPAPTKAPTPTPSNPVAAFDCNNPGYSLPIQVFKIGGRPYEVSFLDFSTGNYTKLFDFPMPEESSPEHSWIVNAVGISPRKSDGRAYGVLGNWDKATGEIDGNYLVRFDASKIEFVLSLDQSTSNFQRVAAGFSSAGNFATSSAGAAVWVYQGEYLEVLSGYSDASQVPADVSLGGVMTTMNIGPSKTGHDLVFIKGSFENEKETFEYGVTIPTAAEGTNVKIVLVNLETSASFELTCAGTDDLSTTKWGSGWVYEGEVYFSNNEKGGVYRIDQNSIDTTKGSVRLEWVSKSALTNKNDGMNCPYASNPFPPVPNPTPRPTPVPSKPPTFAPTASPTHDEYRYECECEAGYEFLHPNSQTDMTCVARETMAPIGAPASGV